MNPLLERSSHPFSAIPFDAISEAHFVPALTEAMTEAKARIQTIVSLSSPATFDNTMLPLETCAEHVDTIGGIFFNLLGAHSSPSMQSLAKDISPMLSAFANDITLDETLFARIQDCYEHRESMGLTPEQHTLLEKTYRNFVRNGALLSNEKKNHLRQIDAELSRLKVEFGEHLLNATNAFELWIDRESDLEGIPAAAIEAARSRATQKGDASRWLFNLQFPSYEPVVKYASQRPIRERMVRAYAERGTQAPNDNREIVKRMAVLRHQRAQLLGFSTHAHFVLEERMAQTPEQVWDMIESIRKRAYPVAQTEFKSLAAMAKHDGIDDIQLWDRMFYTEKCRENELHFNDECLRPYFQLARVIDGAFQVAGRLYHLSFIERRDVPTYHPDVQVYEVRDGERHMGLFYTDFYARESKQGGAWMTSYREQGLFEGSVIRPHVSIVCNFPRPTATRPSLLNLNEVRTIFHEFGHALHALLSDGVYRSLSGTNVYWDFVELPSQIMENWIQEKPCLDLFAKHIDSGECLSDDLIEKIQAARRFMEGTAQLRQSSFDYLDMRWHAADPSSIADIEQFERDVFRDYSIFPAISGALQSCGFSHLFDGGYSAGYYSYHWAAMLDADAFSAFQEKGIFNRDVATRFRTHILSRGGTDHPMKLYLAFRGRAPSPDAFFKRSGL